MTLPPISVAGAGNWLVSHDAIGPEVLERLAGRYGSEVELCPIGSSGLGLLDHLRGQELLIVVDAGLFDGAPGEIRIVDPWEQAAAPTGAISLHQVGPVEALGVAKLLYPHLLPRRAVLVLVQTEGLAGQAEEETRERVIAVLDQQITRTLEQRSPQTTQTE